MQISRRILLAGVAATALLPLALPADDTDAQAKARQALEHQLNTLPAQPAVRTQTPPAPGTNQPARPKTPKEARTQPAPDKASVVTAKPQPAVPPATPKAPAPAPTTPTPPPQSATAPPVAPPVAATPSPQPNMTLPAQPASGSAAADKFQPIPTLSPEEAQANAKAQEALRQKMANLNAQPTAAEPGLETSAPGAPGATEVLPSETPRDTAVRTAVLQANRAKLEQKETKEPSVMALPGLQPLTGPPSPIPLSKVQSLEALLQRYKLDQISPEQYHEQRAKILADP